MIHYTKNEPASKVPWFTAFHENGTMVGTIDVLSDGKYYYWPSPSFVHGVIPASLLRDLANKLDSINGAHEACTAYTPDHPPK